MVYIGFYPYFWVSDAREIKLKEIYGNRTYHMKAQDHTIKTSHAGASVLTRKYVFDTETLLDTNIFDLYHLEKPP